MLLIRLYSSRSSFRERRLRNDFSSSSLIRLSSRNSFSRLGRFLEDRKILWSLKKHHFPKKCTAGLGRNINKLSTEFVYFPPKLRWTLLLNNFRFPFFKTVYLFFQNISTLKHIFLHIYNLLFILLTFYCYFVAKIHFNYMSNFRKYFLISSFVKLISSILLESYLRSLNVER